jgi:hypothetical protein
MIRRIGLLLERQGAEAALEPLEALGNDNFLIPCDRSQIICLLSENLIYIPDKIEW